MARELGADHPQAVKPRTKKPQAQAQASAGGRGADRAVSEARSMRAARPAGATGVKRRGTAQSSRSATSTVAGVRISHPERVLYPESGITKLDIAQYYAGIASHILPFLRARPLSLVRCPAGTAGTCFFQKHATGRQIPGIGSTLITESGGEKPYVIAGTAKALAGLAQMGTLELHAWNATSDNVERADTLILDLDPDEGLPFAMVVQAALECRATLAAFGLESYAKTTGGKGLHVVVPLSRRVPWETVKRFARGIATQLAANAPDRYTVKAAKTSRTGRIFIDYLRNARGATAVAPYSVRARPGATVATPLSWAEVDETLDPAAFDVRSVVTRLADHGDPWAAYRTRHQTITVEMQRQLGRVAAR